MSSIMWRFPSNDHGENKGINDSGVATFRGTPLKSLAREICQNSLDAAKSGVVTVEFDVFNIKTEDVPGINVLRDTFKRCLEYWGQQRAITTKEFFTNALEVSEKEECSVLRISDFNTTGLTGTREEINSNWTNLTKSSGASDKKGTAGGSYGIGKYAPFACSDFSTVFYSTYDENGEEAYQGVSRLVTFRREDDETTQGIGYYGNDRNTPVYEQFMIEPEYQRDVNDSGTDVYIIGYKYGHQDWKKDIVVSILDGFLGAIWNEKLIVLVGDIKISRGKLNDLVEIYKDDLTDYTEKYYETLVSKDTTWIEEDFMGFGLVRLGLLIGDPDAPRRIAMIRKTGMKIMDKDRLPGHVPFVGIMFIEGDKINEKLRVMENPEHTQWQPDRAKDVVEAKELLKALNRFVKDKIEELVSTGSGNEIDAVGVGTFLPDISDDPKDKSKEEVVSDKVVEIEKKKPVKRTVSGEVPGSHEMDDEQEIEPETVELPDGEDEDFFHPGGNTTNPGPRDAQPAHSEKGNEEKRAKKISVSLKKFIPICVDKTKGQYVFMIVPSNSGDDGVLEVYLSAETQNYEAQITEAAVIGGESVTVQANKIEGIHFVENQPLRIRVGIDYYEMCAMEVKAYATSK